MNFLCCSNWMNGDVLNQAWSNMGNFSRKIAFKQPMGIWLKTWYLVLSEYGAFFLTDWLGKYHILGQTCSGWGWNQQTRYYQDTFFDCILNDFEHLTSYIVFLSHNSISQYQTHELHGVTLLVWRKVGSHENHRFSRMSIRPMHVGYPVRKSARGFSTVSLKLGCQVNS